MTYLEVVSVTLLIHYLIEQDIIAERERRRSVPAVWQLLSTNAYSHRRRKRQDDDDIMICQCNPPWRGGPERSCGPDCINRMLCIECVDGFCPCEKYCTNQMFGKKMYAKLDIKPAGLKGFGLYAGAVRRLATRATWHRCCIVPHLIRRHFHQIVWCAQLFYTITATSTSCFSTTGARQPSSCNL